MNEAQDDAKDDALITVMLPRGAAEAALDALAVALAEMEARGAALAAALEMTAGVRSPGDAAAGRAYAHAATRLAAQDLAAAVWRLRVALARDTAGDG